ncbi:MAG: histidine phosphatase family protein, partial [Nitrososphaerales archaeon]
MALVMLMRHGEAVNNVEHILAGRELEFHLTERGRMQVTEIAEKLKTIPLQAIYTSPITRTVETSKIVSEKVGLDYSVDDRLIETDMGTLTGKSYGEVVGKYGNRIFQKFYEGDNDLQKEMGIESFSAIRSRVMNMLDYVAAKHPDENVLLVTHLDPVKAAMAETMG